MKERIKNLNYKDISMKILIVALLGILTQVASAYLLGVILDNFFPETAEAYANNISVFFSMTLRMLLYVCVLAPATEELVFRFVVLGLLKRFLPFVVANTIQALLFGIYHGNMVQGVYAFLLGVFIGYLCYICGGVIYTIVFHIFVNFTGIYLDDIINPSTPFIIQTVIAVISMVIIILLTLYLRKNKYAK